MIMHAQHSGSLNIGLAGVNPYTGNLGVTALAWSTLCILEEIARAKKIQFNYFVLRPNGPVDDVVRINGVDIKTRQITWDYNGRPKSLAALLLHPGRIADLVKLDIVFDIGLGDSFSDIYGLGRFREVNGLRTILHFLKTKLILLPQTYGPFKSKEAIMSATKTLKNARIVFTRDSQSNDYVKTLLPELKTIQSMDVAFFLPFVKQFRTDTVVRVGINVSALLWNGGYTKNNQFNLKSDYQTLMKGIVSHFAVIPNTEVYLIAHVLPEDEDSIENDYQVCKEIHAKLPVTFLAPHFTNPVEAKSFISGLDFFIGARMHACIAAYSTEVPVFPLAYSRKFNGLFGDTLKYPFYGDLTANTQEEILLAIKSAFINREELKNQIIKSESLVAVYKNELTLTIAGLFDKQSGI